MSETINGPARTLGASAEVAARPARAASGAGAGAGSAVVMDGVAVGLKVRKEAAVRAQQFLVQRGRAPGLAVVQVGEDRASSVYVSNKRRACREAGIESIAHDLPASATE
ncbi:MAG: tetrahydrofolate dehydrogenase/cyclohydrolase catalytic domain-containing protein, partial [Steroidobacteraceae bacterium]